MNNYSELNCTAQESAVPANYNMANKLGDIKSFQHGSIDILTTMLVQMFGGEPLCQNKKEIKCMDNDLDDILENAQFIKAAIYELAEKIGIC